MEISKLVATCTKRKRVGRGGSRGGTAGRGHKGQKARSSGTVGPIFEGGQMPLHRRLPKRGFSNYHFRKEYDLVTLEQLEKHFAAGTEVTKALLYERGLIAAQDNILVKVLGNGTLSKKLVVCVDAWSQSAAAAIQKLGGEVRGVEKSA